MNGKQAKAIVQDAQFDRVTDKILHVDFMEAVPGKYLTVKIPVVTHGSPLGVKKGGKLQAKIRRLTVKGLVDDLPDHITIEVAHLELGESILIKELKNDKLKFLDPQNAAVVTVVLPPRSKSSCSTAGAAVPAAGSCWSCCRCCGPAAAVLLPVCRQEGRQASCKKIS